MFDIGFIGYVKGLSKISIFLVFLSFLMNLGFFLMIPYLSMHFQDSIGLTTTLIGVILGIRIISQKGTTFFGGVLSDYFGFKTVLFLGCIIRSLGFLMFGLANNFTLLVVASVLAGIGGALFSPATRSAIVIYNPIEELRKKIFSLINIVNTLGMMIGPILGMWLLNYSFFLITIVTSGIYIIAGLLIIIVVKTNQATKQKNNILKLIIINFQLIITNKPFLKLVVFSMGYFFTAQQLYIIVPIISNSIGKPSIAAWSFTIVSLIVILGQIPMDKLRYQMRLKNYSSIILGFSILVFFTLPIAFSQSVFTLLLFVIGISLSMIIIQPIFEISISKLADEKAIGSYFGFAQISMAVGGALGNIGGGALIDLSSSMGIDAFPWLCLIIINAVCAFGFYYAFVKNREIKTQKLQV